MRYNSIDISKYSRSLFRLNELIRQYGTCEILDYDEKEFIPENACVVVAGIMEDLGLDNLIEWKYWWKIWKHHREDLTIEQLTVVIYNAMAEFKQCYLDLMLPDNASDEKKLVMIRLSLGDDRAFIKRLDHESGILPEAFNYSITPEDLSKDDPFISSDFGRRMLKEIGVKHISTTEDIDMLLWRIAFMGYDISRGIRNAIVELTNCSEMIDYIDFRCHQYNRVIGNQRIIRGNYQLEELRRKFNIAIQTLNNIAEKKRKMKNK